MATIFDTIETRQAYLQHERDKQDAVVMAGSEWKRIPKTYGDTRGTYEWGRTANANLDSYVNPDTLSGNITSASAFVGVNPSYFSLNGTTITELVTRLVEEKYEAEKNNVAESVMGDMPSKQEEITDITPSRRFRI